ncbi:uncharacterized protein LOC118756316, partial [Rhagoletis pomonella]|uniref:uncharacterized protein LOC118756316 n=1 Tax=Rhagoletis pomonella TaxID=28610 RepID=UPI0017865F75
NNVSLSKLSPFAIKKCIEAVSTEVDSISQLRDGNLLVLTRNPQVAEKFLKIKTFSNLCLVNVKLHDTLNSVKGVIYAPCLKHVDEEEIINEMKDQHVTGVYKFSKIIKGERTITGQMVLTFDLYRLPETVDVAWYKVKVQPYIPSPMRCKRCQKLGHTIKRCERNPMCFICNLPPHDPEDCTRIQCANCEEEHPSSDKNCSKFKEAKEILKIQTLEKCSVGEARRKYKSTVRLPPLRGPYSDIVRENETNPSSNAVSKDTATTSPQNQNSNNLESSIITEATTLVVPQNQQKEQPSKEQPLKQQQPTTSNNANSSLASENPNPVALPSSTSQTIQTTMSPISLFTQNLLKNNDYFIKSVENLDNPTNLSADDLQH